MSRILRKKKVSLRRAELSRIDKQILNRLQAGIPFVARPWENIAAELLIKEGLLLKRIAFLKKQGIIRRISAGFAPGKIGFASTLIAAKVAPENIKKAVERINSYSEVTHNYKRDDEYNIWFTLVARNHERIAQIKQELTQYDKVKRLTEFPAVKLFKIDVNLRA